MLEEEFPCLPVAVVPTTATTTNTSKLNKPKNSPKMLPNRQGVLKLSRLKMAQIFQIQLSPGLPTPVFHQIKQR